MAHSHVIAGRPSEAQPEELCSITAHYEEEPKKRSIVCVCVCVGIITADLLLVFRDLLTVG